MSAGAESRIYAIMQKGALKHIAFYDENHNLKRVIDYQHVHDGRIPHVHSDVYHTGKVGTPTKEDEHIYNQVREWMQNNKYGGTKNGK